MSKLIGFVAFRKDSKRLEGKNGRVLGGKSLYQRALEKLVILQDEGLLAMVVASTDSMEWREDCLREFGSKITLHERPSTVSDDLSSDTDVIRHFLSSRENADSYAVLLFLCTYPFASVEMLRELILKHRDTGLSIFAVKECQYFPQKLLRCKGDVLRPYFFEKMNEFECNTQKLKAQYPAAYIGTSSYLIANANRVLQEGADLWHQDDIQYVVEEGERVVDIDTLEDFKLAEFLLDSGIEK